MLGIYLLPKLFIWIEMTWKDKCVQQLKSISWWCLLSVCCVSCPLWWCVFCVRAIAHLKTFNFPKRLSNNVPAGLLARRRWETSTHCRGRKHRRHHSTRRHNGSYQRTMRCICRPTSDGGLCGSVCVSAQTTGFLQRWNNMRGCVCLHRH